MKTILRILIVIVTLNLSLIILTGSVINNSFSGERNANITFDELTHDFGKVEAGIELTYAFKFKNTGDGILIINSVNAACGCTGATVGDKKEFGKNEKGEIKVSFNTQGRDGAQIKTVTVQTNDPDRPQVVLTFTCDIALRNN